MTDGGSECRDPSRVSNRRTLSGMDFILPTPWPSFPVTLLPHSFASSSKIFMCAARSRFTSWAKSRKRALGTIHVVGLFPWHARAGSHVDAGAEIDGQQQFRAGHRSTPGERVDEAAVAGVDRQTRKPRAFGEFEVDAGDSRVFEDGKACQVRRVLGRCPVKGLGKRPSLLSSNPADRSR